MTLVDRTLKLALVNVVCDEKLTQEQRSQKLAMMLRWFIDVQEERGVSFDESAELWNQTMVQIVDEFGLRRH